MEKKIVTIVLVAIIGILAGVLIVMKRANDPLLQDMLKKQHVLLETQQRIEKKIDEGKGVGGNSDLAQKVQAVETRLAVLEAQVKNLQGAGNNQAAAPTQPPQEDFSKVYNIPVGHSLVKGNKNAPVTIVEFVDFQCPFCARFHPPVEQALKAYPKQVNYILKNFPLSFHPQSRSAAKAAFAAGEQGKYWEMADALLENGKSLSEEKYVELAKEFGLDVNKFKKDYKDKDAQWEKYIQADMSLAQKVNVRGTPTFYINGKKTRARDFESFKAEIDQILNEKK